MKTILALTLLCLALVQSEDICKQDVNCQRPDCVCGTTKSPFDGLPVEFTPQFVVVSFNDAVTVTNNEFYLNLLTNYTNPNGCRMTMTMYLNHPYNDYALTNNLWRLGCEIGVRSITPAPVDYWKTASYNDWLNEFTDLKKIAAKYGRIPEEDIIGTRAPYMEIGGDEMYKALNDAGFKYDSSFTALQFTNWYGDKPLGALYPYTLDFPSPQLLADCQFAKCPKDEYPGLFVTPVLDLESVTSAPCNMIDACQGEYNQTDCPEKICEDNVFNFLKKNFDYNYKSNRAPFGLHTAHSWFLEDDINKSQAHRQGYKRFLEYATTLDDVWVVSHNRMLEWIKNPVTKDEVKKLEAFQCPSDDPVSICPSPITCTYDDVPDYGTISMKSCDRPCPPHYPWLGNVDGN